MLCTKQSQGVWVTMQFCVLVTCTVLYLHPHRPIPCPLLILQNPLPPTLPALPKGSVQAHEDRNLARKLTPAEKKEKKLKKLVGEANEGDSPEVALYKVMDLSNRQHQFKVRVNAQVSFHLLSNPFGHA